MGVDCRVGGFDFRERVQDGYANAFWRRRRAAASRRFKGQTRAVRDEKADVQRDAKSRREAQCS